VDTAQANLEIALAQLNKADQDVKRLKPLAEQQAVPQQDYDNALAAQQGAQADVAGRKSSLSTSKVNQTAQVGQASAAVMARRRKPAGRAQLEYCNITSPIDGLTGKREGRRATWWVMRGDAAGDGININPLVGLSQHQRSRVLEIDGAEEKRQGSGWQTWS
jgi:multidrug resistance efflux pump